MRKGPSLYGYKYVLECCIGSLQGHILSSLIFPTPIGIPFSQVVNLDKMLKDSCHLDNISALK